MSYQRFGKPGRFYIYMATEGLVVHTDGEGPGLQIVHGPEGRDNAKALIRGLNDFLTREGLTLIIKPGKEPEFRTEGSPR